MKPQESTKALIDSSMLTGLCVVIYIVAGFVPILDIMAVFLTHIPIIVIYLKYGGKYAGISSAASTLIVFFIMGPSYAVRFLFLNATTGLVIGYCGLRKYKSYVTLAALSIVTLISIGLCFKILSFLSGVDFLNQQIDLMIRSYQESLAIIKSAGVTKGLPQINVNAKEIKEFIGIAMPGVFLVVSAVSSYIWYVVTIKILSKLKISLDPVRKISQWYVPTIIAYPIMIILLLNMFIGTGELNPINYTIRFMFIFVFTLNGLSTISYYLNRANITPILSGVILVVVFILLESILVFVGLFEYAFNLRGLDSNRRTLLRKK